MSDLLVTNTSCPSCGIPNTKANPNDVVVGQARHQCHDCGAMFYTNLDLRNRDLRGRSFRWMIMRRADLRGTKLEGCVFEYVILSHANLDGVDLSGVKHFDCIIMCNTNLSGATLPDCADNLYVEHANLEDSNIDTLEGDVFHNQDELHEAEENLCSESGSAAKDFSGQTLLAGEMIGLDLRGANFRGCTIVTYVFQDCDLTGAVFDGATLKVVEFENCIGVDVSGAASQTVVIFD